LKTINGKHEPSRRGRAGFTLIEVLTVIGIMSLLLATIIVVASGVGDRAKVAGTKGLLHQISMAMQRYYNEFKEYPPDGYDTPVVAPNGAQLKGSACLTYYLGWMYADSGEFKSFDMKKNDYTDPDNIRIVDVHGREPFWMDLKPKDNLNEYGEVLDKWRNPLRYDNCEKTKAGVVQYTQNPSVMKGGGDPDPRQSDNGGKAFNPGAYDFWSCGKNGNTDEMDTKDDIIGGLEESR